MQKQTWQRYFSGNSRLTSFIGQNGINQCLYQNMLKLVQDCLPLGESESYRMNGLLCHSWLQKSSMTFHSVCMHVCMRLYVCVCLCVSSWRPLRLFALFIWVRIFYWPWSPAIHIDRWPVSSRTHRFLLSLCSLPQCWEVDSVYMFPSAENKTLVLTLVKQHLPTWFKEVKEIIYLWIHTVVHPASNTFGDIQ